MMASSRFFSFLKSRARTTASVTPSASGEERTRSWPRKLVSGAVLCLTGGIALSAIDDLIIFYGCSSKAIEKASENQQLIEAIGEPIERGPWYNASLAVAHKRHSVSCSFPVSGPLGTGMVHLKAVRNGDDAWFSILRPRDWEILIMEALLHVPGNESKEQTFRISVMDSQPSESKACLACMPQTSTAENSQPQSE